MSLFKSLLHAVQSWRVRLGGGAKARLAHRPGVAVERLDHRQLLAVNFTGNVPIDFPATTVPGVVVLPNNPSVEHPTFSPNTALQNAIQVSGFDINGIRVSYDSQTDILSVGIEQPINPKAPVNQVIAGDADNNGNSATVDPAVLAIQGAFLDNPDLGGTEHMLAFLDLDGNGTPDVVAGIGTGGAKLYQVAQAVVNPGSTRPDTTFGPEIPGATGNVYLVNDPRHPNFEFNINNFSKVYRGQTNQDLTPQTNIGVGALAGSDFDFATEAFFPPQAVNIGRATVPVPVPPTPPVCPPLEPPVLINPHQNSHINTAHPTDIKVNVFGASRFDVNKIVASSVRLGGAAPIFSFTRRINKDPYLDATFVFRGTDVVLPPGIIDARVTGNLNDGTTFDSVRRVFNRDYSFYSNAAIAAQQRRQGGAITNAGESRVEAAAAAKAARVEAQKTVRIVRNTSTPAPIVETIYNPSTQAPAPGRAPARQVAPRHRGTRMADMKSDLATAGLGA